ncbi:unnamed protein product [Caenorhabditis angaria]|uniref:Uncharacterized protein n=1 Tax=Caenorhabditis angaria TaxID=860376 RepID=A0A9P1N1B0_9PELO|nr:unnamed protein product [Caenorhabditis angaria]
MCEKVDMNQRTCCCSAKIMMFVIGGGEIFVAIILIILAAITPHASATWVWVCAASYMCLGFFSIVVVFYPAMWLMILCYIDQIISAIESVVVCIVLIVDVGFGEIIVDAYGVEDNKTWKKVQAYAYCQIFTLIVGCVFTIMAGVVYAVLLCCNDGRRRSIYGGTGNTGNSPATGTDTGTSPGTTRRSKALYSKS